jgi:hypothetical protein
MNPTSITRQLHKELNQIKWKIYVRLFILLTNKFIEIDFEEIIEFYGNY